MGTENGEDLKCQLCGALLRVSHTQCRDGQVRRRRHCDHCHYAVWSVERLTREAQKLLDLKINATCSTAKR